MSPDRFEKVVMLLSSDQPGEVFAAAQAIGRALPEAGLDWAQFSKLVAGRIGPKKVQDQDHNATIVMLLSSDQPGEAFAAAQAIGCALPEAGLDWAQFSKLVAGRIGPKKVQAQVHNATNPNFRAAEREYQARQNPDNITQAEIGMVNILAERTSSLGERDCEFIESMYDRVAQYGRRTFVSAKQRAWLNEIWERVG